MQKLIISTLEDNKAIDIVVIDLSGKSDMADYMVVASGTSDKHVGALASHITSNLRNNEIIDYDVEGTKNCNWVLIDAKDIIVHIFKQELREFYGIEKMWAVSLPEIINEDIFA